MDFKQFVTAVHRAESLVSDAQDDQWNLPPNPVQRVGGRAGGTVSDPTFNITSDERRMKLRSTVVETEQLLLLISKALEQQTRALEDAIDRWQGNFPEKS